jgi:hypothetical protein
VFHPRAVKVADLTEGGFGPCLQLLPLVEPMQLTFVHDRAPYADRLEELSDVTWTQILGVARSAEQLGDRCDGVVIDLRPPIPADAFEGVQKLSAKPALILTSAE